MKSFKSFITEGIKPVKSEYGLNHPDYNNKKIRQRNTYISSIIKVDDIYYQVYLAIGPDKTLDVQFQTSPDPEKQPYSLDKVGIKSTVKVSGFKLIKAFNKIMFVALKLIDLKKPPQITFSGHTPQLEKLYRKFVNNPGFKNEMAKHKYEYKDEGNKKTAQFTFVRK